MHRRSGTLVAVGLAVSSLLAISSPALAAPPPMTIGLTEVPQWAYGILYNSTASGTTPNGTFSISVEYGWQVIFNQTTGPNGTVVLEVERTAGSRLNLTLCRPDCSNPVAKLSMRETAFERIEGFANFTPNGTVNESGTTVPALALENEQVRLVAVKNDSGSFLMPLPTLHRSANLSLSLTAKIGSQFGIRFTPALGILPNSLAPGDAWTSSSAFAATGDVNFSFNGAAVGPNGTPAIIRGSFGVAVNHSGRVNLSGIAGSDVNLSGGVETPEVTLRVDPGLTIFEGALLVPAGADLFQDQSSAWGSAETVQDAAAPAAVDAGARGVNHVGIVASSMLYSAQATSSVAPSPIVPLAGGGHIGGGASPTLLQAQPEAVPSAEQNSNCLVSGGPCASTGSPAPNSSHFPISTPLLTVLAVGLLVGLIAAAVVARRRSVPPPPPSPNARLYAPGARTDPVLPPTRSAPTTPQPPDDPLDHLW